MNDAKYIGLDVHPATISAAVLDSTGKLVFECIMETKAATILQFIHGLRGSLHVTFVFCLGWNWRGRSSVKITERTHAKTAKTPHWGREGRHSETALAGQSARFRSV